MNHQEILRTAVATLNERGKSYGDSQFMFDLISTLATLITGRSITPYEVAVIHECTKLARRRVDPSNMDHYVDHVNYTAFAAQFSNTAPVPFEKANKLVLDETLAKVEAEIAQAAEKETVSTND